MLRLGDHDNGAKGSVLSVKLTAVSTAGALEQAGREDWKSSRCEHILVWFGSAEKNRKKIKCTFQ